MSHNIETVDDRNSLGMTTKGSVPCVDSPNLYRSFAHRPVLTLVDEERTYGGEANSLEILFRHDGIMINPWTADRVTVQREDLFALRELLNELPEESFKRPADPVFVPDPPPAWEDGDVVLTQSRLALTSITYTRIGGRWNRTVLHSKGESYTDTRTYSDEHVDHFVETGYTVLRRAGQVVR